MRRAPKGTPCVIYDGYIQSNGYPKRGRVYVHRETLAEKLGRPIAAGLDACHTCDIRACVQPAHLYEGTRRQNMADCTARLRHNKPRGERHWGAVLSSEDVRDMRALTAEGWSRKSLGERYGVHPATVSRIVRNIARTEVAA